MPLRLHLLEDDTALQDVAAAIAVYEKARLTGRGTEVKLED